MTDMMVEVHSPQLFFFFKVYNRDVWRGNSAVMIPLKGVAVCQCHLRFNDTRGGFTGRAAAVSKAALTFALYGHGQTEGETAFVSQLWIWTGTCATATSSVQSP